MCELQLLSRRKNYGLFNIKSCHRSLNTPICTNRDTLVVWKSVIRSER